MRFGSSDGWRNTERMKLQTDCSQIKGEEIFNLLKEVNLSTCTPEEHLQAFEQSFHVAFLWEGDTLVGCGRLVCDKQYRAAMYDIAVSVPYQKKGYGKKIVQSLLEGTEEMTIILQSTEGNEAFYEKFNFIQGEHCMFRFPTEIIKELCKE